MGREFRLPDLGEGIAEGQIVRILCKEGDKVNEDQDLMEVETDKAAVPIPSPFAGVAQKIHVKEGQTVAVGDVLVTFDGTAEQRVKPQAASTAAATKTATASAGGDDHATSAGGVAAPPKPPAPTTGRAPAPVAGRSRAAAAPAVRKLAREMGVDIDSISGSGPGGRVLREDVQAVAGGSTASPTMAPPGSAGPAVRPAPLPVGVPEVEGRPGTDTWGPIKRQRLTQIRKTIANQMARSVSNIPHVTQTDEADITDIDIMRRELRGEDGSGPRITMMSLILRSLAVCLRQHLQFNASFDAENEEIIVKEYINVGVAVDSPRGLVVPVIRNLDQLSVLAISHQLVQIAEKVRNVQFSVDELRGGTFTVTNYGAVGSILGTPIINYPEVAVLGIGRTQERVVLADDELETRRLLPLSLSFDHRAVDGAQAARFLNDVKAHLESPALLLIK